MALNVCEDHGDTDSVCIWEYGNKCPFCKAEREIQELKEQIDAARAIADDLQKELEQQKQRLADMPDPE